MSKIQVIGTRNTLNIAVSDFLKDILETSGIKVAKVINNGIDTEVFKPPTTQAKLLPNKLLYLGGYSYLGKGLDIIRHLGKLGFHIDCVTNRKISNWPNITFLPQVKRSETIKSYLDHALTIYPSRFESCQMVPLESMACGTPVVISAVGIGQDLAKVIPDFVVTGYSDQSVAEYSQKIHKIIANRDHYSKLAREYVIKRHKLKDFGSAWIKTIEDIYANTL